VNWKYKALLQHAFSQTPFGERLNYLFQRHVTKSLPTSDTIFPNHVALAREHMELVAKYLPRSSAEAAWYEFGAGWELIGPLLFYCLGVNRQVLVDIRHLLRIELVNHTIATLQRLATSLALPRVPLSFIEGHRPSAAVTVLRSRYGIDYRAPCDARATGLPTASIDCITSTNTLEHVPRDDIVAILRECHRILRSDGIMSFRIDYQDHYSYFDRTISRFNFLRYSDRAWAFFNPGLHYQNRLRHRDHLALVDAAGFEVLEERRADPTAADVTTLRNLSVPLRMRDYTPAEIGVRHAAIVLRKRPPPSSAAAV